jgi:hypothetical protein
VAADILSSSVRIADALIIPKLNEKAEEESKKDLSTQDNTNARTDTEEEDPEGKSVENILKSVLLNNNYLFIKNIRSSLIALFI